MVYLIYGSPCSGKTTYVKEHLKAGDIVCDVDKLYTALCFYEEHNEEIYAKEVACMLHENLLNIIRDRKGNWKDAYVISLANTTEKVKADMKRVKADKCIFMDTSFEECIKRAKERPFYFQWIIEEWFETKEETINV